MASKKQGTKKDEGKSLKSKNTVKTIDEIVKKCCPTREQHP